MKPLKSSYPIGHICNPATPYTTAAQTDIRVTWARAKEMMQARLLTDKNIESQCDQLDLSTWSNNRWDKEI